MQLPQRQPNETHMEWLCRCQQVLNDWRLAQPEHPANPAQITEANAWGRLGWIPKADVADKIRAHALGVEL